MTMAMTMYLKINKKNRTKKLYKEMIEFID